MAMERVIILGWQTYSTDRTGVMDTILFDKAYCVG